MLGTGIRAHKTVEEFGDLEYLQAPPSKRAHLRRDYAHLESFFAQTLEAFAHAREQRHAIVMNAVIEFAIREQKLFMYRRVVGEIPHLRRKRLTHLGHELFVGDIAPEHFAHGMMERFENKVVGIDERAVVIGTAPCQE